MPYVLLSLALSLAMGLVCGTLIRNSAGAIVAFFVFSFVVPPLLGLLAMTQDWFGDVRPWGRPRLPARRAPSRVLRC